MANFALPTKTRASVVVGLGSVTSQKWKLFLKDGPYWNYMALHLAAKRYFVDHPDLVDIAVNTAIANVARSLASGKFVYTAPGVGFFRAFLKTVVERTAISLMRSEKRATRGVGLSDESDLLRDLGEDAPADSQTLDAYDKTGGVEQPSAASRKRTGVHLTRLSDLAGLFEEDGREGTRDPASLHIYEEECSRREFDYLKRIRRNVFNLALTSVLCNDRVLPGRRAMLDLLYVQRLKPDAIYRRDEYCQLKRNAFDQLILRARGELKKPVLALWRAVAPESCADSEARLKDLWWTLSHEKKARELARTLYTRTQNEVGALETL